MTPEILTSNRQLPGGLWAGPPSGRGDPAEAHDAIADELLYLQLLRLARLIHHLALPAVQLRSIKACRQAMHITAFSPSCVQVWEWEKSSIRTWVRVTEV